MANTRRPSHTRPSHRQAPWARTTISYATYIDNHDPKRGRGSGDYGEDNFSYDTAHLDHTLVPECVPATASLQLRQNFKNFTLAGAAVDTSVERIEDLNNDAPRRTNPRGTHPHLLSCRPSDESSTTTGAEPSSVTSSFSSGTPSTLASTPAHPNVCYVLPLQHPTPHVPVDMSGLESPPFTPIDSRAMNTPLNFSSKSTAPDLGFVTAELSPLSVRHELAILSQLTRAKNELAWESYLKTLDEEIWDLRHNALMRLKQFRDTIKTLLKEHLIDGLVTSREELTCIKWLDGAAYLYQEMVDAMEAKIKATSCVLASPALEAGACRPCAGKRTVSAGVRGVRV